GTTGRSASAGSPAGIVGPGSAGSLAGGGVGGGAGRGGRGRGGAEAGACPVDVGGRGDDDSGCVRRSASARCSADGGGAKIRPIGPGRFSGASHPRISAICTRTTMFASRNCPQVPPVSIESSVRANQADCSEAVA